MERREEEDQIIWYQTTLHLHLGCVFGEEGIVSGGIQDLVLT